MTTQEALFFRATDEVQGPREQAWQNLVQVCVGLIDEYRTILVGIDLHPMVKNHRDRCLKLGFSVVKVDELIRNYKTYSNITTAK